MGFLSKIVSKAAKKVVPKILIGGDKADRKSVQAVVNTGVTDPIFQKFGDQVETIAKIGGGIATAALGGAILGGAAKASPVSNIIKSTPTSKPVGLLDTITKGINKIDAFSKSAIGSQLTGTLGKIVTNLATPSAGKPSTAAQKVALAAGTVSDVAETISQAAVFQGKGVSVSIGEDPNRQTWWDLNKSWALPAIFAVPGFFMLLFMLFGGRRR